MVKNNVKVVYWMDRYETRTADTEDRWSRGDTAADYTIEGILTNDEITYKDFVVDFEIKKAEYYYLVYVDYGTGDSFGSDDNQLEFVDLFTTRKKAEGCVYSLEVPEGDDRFYASYTKENGQLVEFYKPWEGYFEHLNGIHIAEVCAI